MRIGIEVQRLFRRKKHGMDIVALELIRNLQHLDKKNQYFIFVKPDDDDSVIRETANFHVVRISGGPYPYWEQVLLPREIRKYNLDLLHCTSNTAPLRTDIPLAITLHDIIFLEQWNFTKGTSYQILGNLYRRWNVPRAVRCAKKLITVSENEKINIDKYFGFADEKVAAIHNGVGMHFQRVTDTEVLLNVKTKYNLSDRYVFYPGNSDPRKNLVGVMQALSILQKKDKLDFQVQMLDVEANLLNKIARQIGNIEILKHMAVCGYVPEADLPAIYSMADHLLFPSLREGFGIPILEAMSAGVPVVTSNCSSMPEVAGDAALLIDPENPEQIADAISLIRNDVQLRNDLIMRGLNRVRDFSWQKMAEHYLRVYRNVISV
jgi:glycosyltransferase involved in cell wall biosynthesis